MQFLLFQILNLLHIFSLEITSDIGEVGYKMFQQINHLA